MPLAGGFTDGGILLLAAFFVSGCHIHDDDKSVRLIYCHGNTEGLPMTALGSSAVLAGQSQHRNGGHDHGLCKPVSSHEIFESFGLAHGWSAMTWKWQLSADI